MIEPATEEAIAKAAALIKAGEIVAFPTETVYGLGADATNGVAVAKIFEVKGRPRFNPLIVHVLSVETAKPYAVFDARAKALAKAFWPGPLTLVLPRRQDGRLSDLVTAGLDTVAVRAPRHSAARALLVAAGLPIAAPSANKSGHVSPTLAAHVYEDFGEEVPLILDGGACDTGVESTILDLVGETRLLRSGAVTADEIGEVLGEVPGARISGKITAPGQLASHYAPKARVRLAASEARPGEALLAFGPNAPEGALNLSKSGDLREAAANLYAFLRALDKTNPSAIAVMPIPERGLGLAINDRLRRAAHPRRRRELPR